MNFGIIFLCLLFGCIVGYEAGKYVMGKKISDFLTGFAEKLKKSAEAAKKEQDYNLQQLIEAVKKNMEDNLQNKELTENGEGT